MFVQDVSNFDTVFTAEAPLDSVVEGSQLSQTVQAQFAGQFSFAASYLHFIDHPPPQASPTMDQTCLSAPSNHHIYHHLFARIIVNRNHLALNCNPVRSHHAGFLIYYPQYILSVMSVGNRPSLFCCRLPTPE